MSRVPIKTVNWSTQLTNIVKQATTMAHHYETQVYALPRKAKNNNKQNE